VAADAGEEWVPLDCLQALVVGVLSMSNLPLLLNRSDDRFLLRWRCGLECSNLAARAAR
jgi:hypothetical protein